MRYVGWGGLPQAFDAENSAWQTEFLELGQLLANDEYDRARRSTQDAHYTAEPVVRAIYDGLRRLGFDGGRILEPAAGTGHFIGMMPAEMQANSHVTAIELDPLTAQIGAQLYPSATYINRGLQDVVIPQALFDAVVGNPPFGSQSLYDPQHRELSGLSIHNYFLAKSLEKTRPGGLMAVVVSRYFLDAQNPVAREFIADRAHFLGAVRLPNTAFRRNALTDVTTDIVFFQRAQPGETPSRAWTEVGDIRDPESGDSITLNSYYVSNPKQMIGHMAITAKMHATGADLIGPPGHDLAEEIAQRLTALPANVYRKAGPRHEANGEADKPELVLPDTLKVGSYFVDSGGRLARRLPDQLDRHDYQFVTAKNERAGERIRGLIQVRQALRALMASEQLEASTDADLVAPRAALNRVYDSFVKRHGHISSQANRLAMADDPEYPLLFALEGDYDRGVSPDVAKRHGVSPREPSASKAAIFSKRVMTPRRTITHVETARDALVVSMNEAGRVDMGRMMRLTGRTEASLLEELKGRIYDNPATGAWETADQYLTGNVRAKLDVAETFARLDARYEVHVNALRAVQPAPIDAVDISVQLGSTWVPEKYVDQFVGHLLGDVYRNISYQPSLGMWFAKIGRGDRTTNSVTWGTEHCGANEILTAILTNKPVQVRVPDGFDNNGKPIYRVEPTLTAAAAQKADEIKQAFLDWIWEDKGRREELAAFYNAKFNTNVPARYDGARGAEGRDQLLGVLQAFIV
ncbi:Eco57I restriction-modification methylase domain-containing protein [Achromobacter insuavis]|uniref:Eco57I restriction-modification methylase domain-containing protein n=1 Tax=Achromobacter insuavis TaxID=1287735 RepID=UPI003B969E5F